MIKYLILINKVLVTITILCFLALIGFQAAHYIGYYKSGKGFNQKVKKNYIENNNHYFQRKL